MKLVAPDGMPEGFIDTKPIAGKAALKPDGIEIDTREIGILNPLQAKQH